MNAHPNQVSLPLEIAISIVRKLHRYVLVVLAASLLAAWLVPSVRADSLSTAAAPALPRPVGPDQGKISREYLIKAAILLNLASFATWPDSAFDAANAPVRICILGRNPFGRALESLEGRRVGLRKLVSTSITGVEYAAACHILFVGDSEWERLPAILDAVSGLPVLTVADYGEFAAAGGIIGLSVVENHSRLEINVRAAEQAGVKLSPNLLRLAKISTQ